MRCREAVSLLPFALASSVHVGAKLTGSRPVDRVSKAMLVPLLGLRLLAAPRRNRRTSTLLFAELLFSWIGDLTIDRSFRTGLAAFFAAHLCLIILFWTGFRTRMSPWSALLLPWLLVMVVVLRPRLTTLYPAVVAYATILATMAASAGRGGRRIGLGGVLFVISDSLLAFRQFTPWFRSAPWGAVVMASYLAAQALLVDGVLTADQ